MKTQRLMLSRALELLDKNMIIIGGDFRIKASKEEWTGNRYNFLATLESIISSEGYEYNSESDAVIIRLIGSKDDCEKNMILIKDLL